MAAVTAPADPPITGERLTVESIPVVDLRFLSQSELSALSRCSLHAVDLTRCDDVVIPKIDRSVFNESAGSRKQTYSRFRLARRNKPPHFSSPSSSSKPNPNPNTDNTNTDNSSIISLFKRLFNSDAAAADADADADAIPVSTAGKKKQESTAMVVYNGDGEVDKVSVNRNGVAVDLGELAGLEDPYGAEIRRRTNGMDKDEELLGFLTGLEGQWGSRRRRRKIVDANEFGDVLPNGWKVLIAMKKKQGQCWLFCRRYISPSGRYFMSCKDVSSYLMSLGSFTFVKQPPLGVCSEPSQSENQLVTVNAESTDIKDEKVIPVSLAVFEPDNSEKQNTLVKDVHVGTVQEGCLFRCHKCSTPFYEKNHLLHHLVSCHKRKRRKSGMPVEDDELLKEGHYECQFCNKRFTERVCFFGHVGIHVKNYVKSIEGSPGVSPMQTNHVLVSTGGVPPTSFLEKLESVEVEVNDDPVSVTPDIAASKDVNVDSTCDKLRAESDLKDLAHSGDHGAILSSVDGDQINIASSTDGTAVENPIDKQDTVPELMDEEVGGVENDSGTADLELDSSSGYENVRNSDTCQTSIEDSVIVEAADVIGGSKVHVQSTDGLATEAQNSAGLLNDGHEFCNAGEDGHIEQMISESEMLDEDKNNAVDGNTEARILCNDNVGDPSYGTEFRHRVIDHELMFGPSDSEIDLKMNETCEVQQERHRARSPVVPQGKEDTALPEALSDSFHSNGIGTQSVFVLPGEVISNILPDNTNTVSAFRVPEPRKDDICGNMPFPSSIVVPREEHPYRTESSSPCRASSRKEPNSAGVVNSANLFNPKSSLDANRVPNKESVNFLSSHLCSPLGSREAPNDSNLFGTCNSVMDESKRKRESGSIFSSLSVGGHAHGLTGQIHHTRDSMNVNTSSAACATHIPDLAGSISDINTGVLPSFPPQTIAASPSPFSLWNDQPFGLEQTQSRVCVNPREEDGQDHVSATNSLSLASFQQTCNAGYNLNETYISTVDNFSRMNALETDRDTDLMIGFRNMSARTNQDVVSEVLWRGNEGNAMQSGLGDSSSSHGQLTGAFQPFDFLSDKGENDIFGTEKFDNITNFGGLRSTTVEPMEFSFLTPQDSNPQLGGQKVLSYGNPGIEQGFESSVWLGKDASLPNMSARSSFSTVCVWCGSQFQQESIDADAQAGSIGYLCPTCKARISGQY